MTEQTKGTKPTEKSSLNQKADGTTQRKTKELQISPALARLMKKSRKVPHPGTVRITIFPNPRVKKKVPAAKGGPEES
jgi:hypothetical protein